MVAIKNQDFVNEIYTSLLDRLPDPEGMKSHLSLLDKGRSKADVTYSLLSSDEFHRKGKNWTVVHEKIRKILHGEFQALKNYPALIEIISNGKKLPSRQQDLEKLKATTFLLAGDYLIHINKIISGFGLIIDIIDSKTGFTPKSLSEEDLHFNIDGKEIIAEKYGNQFLLCTPIKSEYPIEIKCQGRTFFKDNFQNLDLQQNSDKLNVAIVGRFEKTTSIGALSLTFLHHLHDEFNCVLIDTRPGDSRWESLDEGLSKLKSPESSVSGIDVAIYTDVFSNSLSDVNYKKVPEARIKIAYVVFDSTRLPSWWVDSLNTSFDAVITTSKWGKAMIENSGVNVPVFFVPLSLDLSLYDHKKLRTEAKQKFRFGSVASFSHRKNIKQLVTCFLDCFEDSDDVELVIHTPLSYGSAYNEIIDLIKQRKATNIIISHEELSEYNYASLMNSFDVYVLLSKGECYSITPRQAFALGKPAIITAGHAHDEMIETGLFQTVKVSGYEQAHYEAFDGQAIGLQCCYKDSDICKALRTAYFKYTEISAKSADRIAYANTFRHDQLRHYYTNLVAPKNAFLDTSDEILKEGISISSRALYQKYSEIKAIRSKAPTSPYKFQKIVVPVHDGGFFSVFNTFISHFVWNFGRPDVSAVIPDWRISTLRSYRSVNTPMSFCYGTEADGNIFTKLFLPIPDMPIEIDDYNNDQFLKTNTVYFDNFNEQNEPLLTYINARELYRTPDFSEWRHRYGRFYKKYFRIKDTVKTQIEALVAEEFKSEYVIGVHIKHPSHAIEQPNGFMPEVSNFIRKILDVIEEKNLTSYKIFLATDQDSVVNNLISVFGNRVIFRGDVARTTLADDARYRSLGKDAQMREGHQIQNLLAADPSRWSLKMAEDVIIDAHLLASCDCFIHVTSNIATAVSYINPNLEMIYCE